MRPTPFPECLKLSSKSKSSQRPHFKCQLETPPPGSLPRFPCLTLALQVFGFLPQVHTGRGLQGPCPGQARIQNGSQRDRLRNLSAPVNNPMLL